eukprot:337451-Rhodomonas_salina.3
MAQHCEVKLKKLVEVAMHEEADALAGEAQQEEGAAKRAGSLVSRERLWLARLRVLWCRAPVVLTVEPLSLCVRAMCEATPSQHVLAS